MDKSRSNSVENMPFNTATFYQKEFLKAKEEKQEAFIEQLFSENADLCQRFLDYIRPPVVPLSNSTDLDELSNEIAARVMDIDPDDYLSEAYKNEEDADYNRPKHHEKAEMYDKKALKNAIEQALKPYAAKAMDTLKAGHFVDASPVLLSIYEAQFLVEEPDMDDSNGLSYQAEIHAFFEHITTELTQQKEAKQADSEAVLALFFDRWKHFKRFHGKSEAAPYELLNSLFFFYIIKNAKAEKQFFDFMSEHNLHTAAHYSLTKSLCDSLNKNDFLLEKLTHYGLNNAELSKALMQQFIDKKDRTNYLATAQKAYEKYKEATSEFIAEKLLPTDNLGFFKKILAEVAANKHRIDLYHRWREHATPTEQEAYFEAQRTRNASFFVALLHDANRQEDLLEFAEDAIENFNSNAFEMAAKLLVKDYPDDVFSFYCERLTLFMNNGASSKNHYETAVSMLEPLKNIKGKTTEIKEFVEELRKKYSRLPAFLEELTKKGF